MVSHCSERWRAARNDCLADVWTMLTLARAFLSVTLPVQQVARYRSAGPTVDEYGPVRRIDAPEPLPAPLQRSCCCRCPIIASQGSPALSTSVKIARISSLRLSGFCQCSFIGTDSGSCKGSSSFLAWAVTSPARRLSFSR